MTPVLHYPLLEPHNARGIPPSEASCRTSRGRRAFEHTTAPYQAPRSFWRQQAPHTTSSGTKLALLAQNGSIWHVFLLLGEFCPVFVSNKPSRENFLPHQPRHHHGHERNNTPTQHSKPRGETFTAPARHKQPKITHFHHAGANFLSTTGVKTKPTNSRMQFHTAPHQHNHIILRIPTSRLQTMKHIRGNCMRNYWSTKARRPEKSHVIRLDERSTTSENIAIPTI